MLGKSPSWQDAGGACSGYLVEEAGTVLLLDCGNGVFSKLRRFRDYVAVDAVVISHLHADHFLDLVPYAYALTYAPRQQPVPVDRWPGTDHPARPRLYAPRGARQTFRRVVGAWGNGASARRFTYGADTAPTDDLVRFAEGTDLLMLEATLPRPERGGVRGHLTPAEAGEHGARANARRLVLTHFSDELDEHWTRREAERAFAGPVTLAREGAVYEI